MDTSSYWIESGPMTRFPSIEQNVSVDVIIIGGGIVGLTAGYLLKAAGKTVAILERDRCARVDTGHTTAHVTAVTDLSREKMVKSFGRDAAKVVWDGGVAALDQIVKNIGREDISCNFRWVPGYLHAPLDPTESKEMEREREALEREATVSRELGITAEFTAAIPFFDLPGIKFSHQAIFHPRKYLAALARTIPGQGSYIFEHAEAGEIKDDPLSVSCGEFKVEGGSLVLATHNPLMGVAGTVGAALFQTKLALYSSYAIGAKIPAGMVPEASFWDTADPYNYLRVERRRGFDYAILGGEDHKTGQSSDTTVPYRRLEERLLRFVSKAEIDYRWSGQVIETNDGLPLIGEMVKHQFGATGFSGNGITFGTLGAMMATDWVLGRKNPWRTLFDPGRKSMGSGWWTFLEENKDYPYYMVRDWMAPADTDALGEVKKGEGKIVSLDGKKVAAYRASSGTLSLCSPICTHLKCIVNWNKAESTWDCPCHGSRFKPTGEVISGPAEEALETLPLPAGKEKN